MPLPEQDRARWNHEAIAQAVQLLDAALSVGRRGPLQIEAAISAVHCRAATAADTDWKQVAALYEELEQVDRIPAVRVNRAFAVARADGPAAGLALLDVDAERYPYVHLVRGTLLAELGKIDEARASLTRARAMARNEAERLQIEDRIARLADPHEWSTTSG